MLKSWVRRTFQIVGTVALVALVIIVWQRTDWSKGFTPDGIMTLIAGVLAFAAVQWQMWDHRRTQREEQERQKRAVATAILFEIDLIYRSMIRDSCEAIQNAAGGGYVVKPHSLHFTVYEANAGNIGQLPPRIAQDVVVFYGSATRILVTLQVYSDAVSNAHEAPSRIDWKAMASQYHQHTVKAIPSVKLYSYLVSRRLCEYTGVEFTAPTIAVASENLNDLQALEREAQT